MRVAWHLDPLKHAVNLALCIDENKIDMDEGVLKNCRKHPGIQPQIDLSIYLFRQLLVYLNTHVNIEQQQHVGIFRLRVT